MALHLIIWTEELMLVISDLHGFCPNVKYTKKLITRVNAILPDEIVIDSRYIFTPMQIAKALLTIGENIFCVKCTENSNHAISLLLIDVQLIFTTNSTFCTILDCHFSKKTVIIIQVTYSKQSSEFFPSRSKFRTKKDIIAINSTISSQNLNSYFLRKLDQNR